MTNRGSFSRKRRLLPVAFMFLAIISIVFLLGGCSDESTSQTSKPSTTPYPPAITTLPADCPKYDAGEYTVGENIPAGEYVLIPFGEYTGSGSVSIYWDVAHEKLYESDFSFRGNSIMYFPAGKYIELKDCYAIPFEQAPNYCEGVTTVPDGVYKIGYHIPAGEYKIESDGEYDGNYTVYNTTLGSSSKKDIATINSFSSSQKTATITVEDGQYLKLSYCIARLTGSAIAANP